MVSHDLDARSQSLLSLGIQTPQSNRRLMIIPFLFIALMVLTLGYTLQSLHSFKQESVMLELLTQQRLLRTRYINQLFLPPDSTQTSAARVRSAEALLEESRHILDILIQQHYPNTLQNKNNNFTLPLLPTPNKRVKAELLHKQELLNTLEEHGRQLVKLSPGSSAYQKQLKAITWVVQELDRSKHDLPQVYLADAHHRLNTMIFMNVALMLLVGGAGFGLALMQQRAEKILLKNEYFFRQIFDASPIGKILASVDGQWLTVNPALCQLLGYTDAEMIGKTFNDFLAPEDQKADAELRQKLLSKELKSYQTTQRYQHKNGHLIWTLATVAPVFSDKKTIQYLVIQLVDISEERKTLEALQVSERKYRSVVESATDGIILARLDGSILSANTHASLLFGYEENELNTQPLTRLIPPLKKIMQSTCPIGEDTQNLLPLSGHILNLQGQRKDGGSIPLEISLSKWSNTQQEFFFTTIIRDLTQRKQAEKEHATLLQSNKDLEEFAIIASHDMQEPLRKIAFYTAHLEATHAKPSTDALGLDNDKTIHKILGATQRMQTLIGDLLSYSRILSQGRPFVKTSLNDVLNEVISQLEGRIHAEKACIDVMPLPSIEADEAQMRQLFINLLDNGLKYHRDGVSPRIRIYGSVQKSQFGNALDATLYIEDNGIGFDEKYLDRIFKVFQRLHTREHYSGTGIGLATCRRIVERHRGAITAHSRPNEGSTFIITLPVQQRLTEQVAESAL